MSSQTVLVTGANGFLGSAVAKAFSLAGWTTYGLIRSQRSAATLLRNEIIPIIGSATDPSFLASLPPFDVVVSTTEDLSNYVTHFNDTLTLLKCISSRTAAANKKLLVLFTSGCKDYGTTPQHGAADLAPHTEDSPLNPPALLAPRMKYALTLFGHSADFDAIVLRPTTLYGYSGSYYAPFFVLAQQALDSGSGILKLNGHPNSILHGTHVSDVASAYLSLACAPRAAVVGQVFNIASQRYETLHKIGDAVAKSYGLEVRYTYPGKAERPEDLKSFLVYLVDFSQWVGSEKIRETTRWRERKHLFAAGFETYRAAYEQAKRDGDEGVVRMERNLAIEF